MVCGRNFPRARFLASRLGQRQEHAILNDVVPRARAADKHSGGNSGAAHSLADERPFVRRRLVSITAASQPSIEGSMGAIPGLPKVHLHNACCCVRGGRRIMAPFPPRRRGPAAAKPPSRAGGIFQGASPCVKSPVVSNRSPELRYGRRNRRHAGPLRVSSANSADLGHRPALPVMIDVPTARTRVPSARVSRSCTATPRVAGAPLRPLVWAHTSANVPAFDRQCTVDLTIPLTFDFRCRDDEVLPQPRGAKAYRCALQFSGMICLPRTHATTLQIARIPAYHRSDRPVPLSLCEACAIATTRTPRGCGCRERPSTG
jgi:hypothetical protein